jgi:hypothetical protein
MNVPESVLPALKAIGVIVLGASALLFAGASFSAEGPALPPAEYKPLPVGTKVKYDSWAFEVKRSDGFESAVRIPRTGKWFRTYAVFGRGGKGVYSLDGGPDWETTLGDGPRSALKSLWPLQVGKKAGFGFQEKYDGGGRTWKLTLEVTGTENLVLNNMAYPTYVVREHASSDGDGSRAQPALEYAASHWYNPDSGLVLKSRREWIRSGFRARLEIPARVDPLRRRGLGGAIQHCPRELSRRHHHPCIKGDQVGRRRRQDADRRGPAPETGSCRGPVRRRRP